MAMPECVQDDAKLRIAGMCEPGRHSGVANDLLTRNTAAEKLQPVIDSQALLSAEPPHRGLISREVLVTSLLILLPLFILIVALIRYNKYFGMHVITGPVISSDGTIYVGSSFDNLIALNSDGSVRWKCDTEGQPKYSPVIGVDGTIYGVSNTGFLFAIDPDGKLKWQRYVGGDPSQLVAAKSAVYVSSLYNNRISALTNTGLVKWVYYAKQIFPGIVVGSDGVIYAGSDDHNLYAINPDGTQKWAFKTGSWAGSAPAFGADGTIYAGSFDNNLYAINPNGTQRWKFKTRGVLYTSPAIGSDGTIYLVSWDKNLYAINPNGTQRWKILIGKALYSPTIGADGTIYAGSLGDNLYAINPNGSQRWQFKARGGLFSPPTIGSDGSIYAGADNHCLYAINPNGTLRWKFKTGRWAGSSPSIGADGTIYLGPDNGKLDALNPDGSKKWAFPTE